MFSERIIQSEAAKAAEKKAVAKVRAIRAIADVIFDSLDKEIDNMTLASRFGREETIRQQIANGKSFSLVNIRTDLLDLTEAELKKFSLHLNVAEVRKQLTIAMTGLINVVMDIEASQAEDVAPM